jgi:molecular chaperone DnaK
VENMVRDAEAHAEEDHQRREQIDTKNMADSLAYQAQKQMKDLGDKVSAEDRGRVEGLVKDLQEAINQDNFERMKSLTNELQQALMQVGTAVYAQTPGARTTGGRPGGEDVIDADFVESN